MKHARTTPPRALVFGEALVDVIDGTAFPGGSPLNVAVGLSRLGVDTTLAARFGDDAYGDRIAQHLAASSVAFAEPVAGAETSRAEVSLDATGQARYRFALDSELPRMPLDGIDLVHAGSLGAVLAPGAAAVADAFDDPGARLRSYDPNIRPDLMQDHGATLDQVERLAARSHIVKLSDEDAAWLYPGSDLDDVLARLLALGAPLAVVTRGGEGCSARFGGERLDVPADRVTVVDTVGAGDSFMAALLAAVLDGPLGGALLDGMPLDAADVGGALRFAARAAAVTASRAGANPPWARELADSA
ncbi:PfkB family carbohydrate kinase [Leucobacter chromiiresistens]|uniref:PfkB family carbohydrate kinase n=1 Tax=Leucobacter chromiiresistens TaxID=1079994 RepID=UPI0007342119|nr:PfkB family carbohydrate kinase [Leucobacter chromiiresistens]